ncbi:MAG: DNA primase [Pseudohongiellaceae bacterium]
MAGLIPQRFIDELLSRVDIVDVIDKRVKLKKTGKNWSARCPFHQEKTPSFSVEPDKQFYYCFGCGAGGNALGFVMEFDNTDFPRAVESLAGDYGLEVPRDEKPEDRQRREQHKPLLDALDKADRYYRAQLRRHERRDLAVNYLKSRGLTGEIAARYGIGLAPPGWDNLLKHLLSHSIDRKMMEEAGLVIKRDPEKMREDRDTHYDRFRDRIMFPIRDTRGRVIAFGGRVLGDDKPKYLNSPETPVYHKGRELYGLYEARKAQRRLDRVLVVEGYMDVVALAQHGITHAVATLGTATSADHLQRLFRLVPEIVFCFDGDQAGINAAWRALENALPLMSDGRQIRFLFLPEGEDPDTLVRSQGREAFEALVKKADSLSEYLFNHLSEDLDLKRLDDRARLASLALPHLATLPDTIYRQLLIDRLAELTGTEAAVLSRQLQGQPDTNRQSAPPPANEPPPHMDDGPAGRSDAARPAQSQGPGAAPRRQQARIHKPTSLKAIELLLYKPALAAPLVAKAGAATDRDLTLLDHLDDRYTRLLAELIELAGNDPTTTTYTLLGHCYGTEEGRRLTQLLKSESITPSVGVAEEFNYLIDQLLEQARKAQFRQQLLERVRPGLRSTGNEGP